MLQASGPPIQSWSVCEWSKGGGRDASLRSRQHYTQVPVGAAPTHLSLPVTCIHQLLPGSACHQQSSSTPTSMALPCPGYPCLTALSHISHASFCLIMEDLQQHLLSMEEALRFLSHISTAACHTYLHKERQELNSLLFATHIPSYLFTFFLPFSFHFFFPKPWSTATLESKYKSTETEQCYQESTSLLQMLVALEHLFSFAPPPHSQTHSSLSLFDSSFAHLQLCCRLSRSSDR